MCRSEIIGWLSWVLLISSIGAARSRCTDGCSLAYGSYLFKESDTLDSVLKLFQPATSADVVQSSGLNSPGFILTGISLKISFSCDCINGSLLGHTFPYAIQSGDTYEKISNYYSNLTSTAWLQATNSYTATRIPDTGSLNVTINCSCGVVSVSRNYGLFLTYPLQAGDNTTSLSIAYNISADLLEKYNPSVNFKLGSGLVFIPVKGVIGRDTTVQCRTNMRLDLWWSSFGMDHLKKLATRTNVNVLQFKKDAAVKKMEVEATREFLAELKVLTRVHHVNLVRLIGYCTERALFLIYEYIGNGNLSQHLRGTGQKGPLSWSQRVQIALDSARGLEYIHEHTVPVYIHRDIKSANILIDNNFRGKVADFGLAKLTEVGGASLPTRLVGTFGYMPPEYARYGDVSTKIDVYAFGVVLYELISAKQAVLRTDPSTVESKGLVAMFDNAFAEGDPKENLKKLVDPRLGDNYPIDSVYKMAELAEFCTKDSPQDRPPMRSVVVALMALSSSSEEWDVGSLYENQARLNLTAGR